jgi:hypothetical protein
MEKGMSPAELYYRLAVERGHKPKVTVSRSQEHAVADALARAPDKDADADAAWDWYSKQMRKAEER